MFENSKFIIAIIIAFALFMETLDSTIINTAIPTIASGWNENPVNLKFALTSYLLSLAIFVPISGWAADKFGAKIVFTLAMFLFVFASALCGLSSNLYELVIARFIQGSAGALMMPVGRLILLKSYDKSELVKATSYVTIPSLIGPALGPVLGGVIVTYVSWRWIFYINLPFGLLGILLALKHITNYKIEKNYNFDTVGFILFGLGLAGLSFWLEVIGESFFDKKLKLALIVFSSLCLAIYFIYATFKDHPVFDLKIFKIRTFRITVFASFFSRVGIGGIPFLLPLFFQLGFGLTPLFSGLLLLPYALAMLIMKFYVKDILRMYGFKKVLICNTFILGLTVIQFSFVNSMHYYIIIALMTFVHGIVTSMQFSCMNVLSYVDLEGLNLSKGTSAASAIQQISMSFGIAVSAILLNYFLTKSVSFNQFNISAFHKTFFLLGLIPVLVSMKFAFLHGYDGQAASNHHPRPIRIAQSD